MNVKKITRRKRLAILLTLFLGATMFAIIPVKAVPYSQYDVYLGELGTDDGHDHDPVWGQGDGDFYVKVRVGSGAWATSEIHKLGAGETWGVNSVYTDEYIRRYSFAYSTSETLEVELWEEDAGDDSLIASGSVTISSDRSFTVIEGSNGDCYAIVYVDYAFFN